MHICEERDSLLKEFIDEYKHLEKLCSEIYGQQHGISQYISDMEQTPLYTAGKISGWNGDLNNLKRVRHLRNKMVHDVDDYDSVYEPEDLEFLRTFYQRIISQNDPLALRAQLTKKPAPVKQKPAEISTVIPAEIPPSFIPAYYVPARSIPQSVDSEIEKFENKQKCTRDHTNLKIIAVSCTIILIIILLSLLYWFGR